MGVKNFSKILVFLSTPSARRATRSSRKESQNPEISIHALREEGDALADEQIAAINEFLSTPSARRATRGPYDPRQQTPISIHALREEGDLCGRCSFTSALISIHALREEGDSTPARRRSWLIYFYPRPPRGGRPDPGVHIEIGGYFYPRPPRGGRPTASTPPLRLEIFLSTPSARRATLLDLLSRMTNEFLSTPSARRATFDDW